MNLQRCTIAILLLVSGVQALFLPEIVTSWWFRLVCWIPFLNWLLLCGEDDGGSGGDGTTAVPETPVPTVAETPAPAVPETPAPTVAETPAPAVPETPVPTVAETPAPAVPETPAPTVAETPAPAVPETPAPTVAGTQAPAVPETPAPAVHETPSPAVPETATTTTVGAAGGTVESPGLATLTFDSGVFEEDTEVDIQQVSGDVVLEEKIIEDTRLVTPISESLVPYQIRVVISNLPLTPFVTASVVVPSDFSVPEGYSLTTFASLIQETEEDGAYVLFGYIDCDERDQQHVCDLPGSSFVEQRDGTYASVLTMVPVPSSPTGNRHLLSRTMITDNVTLDDCTLSPIVCPVQGGCRVTSAYQNLRCHPTYNDCRPHRANDIRAAVGTPVLAAANGRIDFRMNSSTLGGMYILRHEDENGVVRSSNPGTRYGHLSEFIAEQGDRVKVGQIIGLSGGAAGHPMSGISRSPHLHFEYSPVQNFRYEPRRVDPSACMYQSSEGDAVQLHNTTQPYIMTDFSGDTVAVLWKMNGNGLGKLWIYTRTDEALWSLQQEIELSMIEYTDNMSISGDTIAVVGFDDDETAVTYSDRVLIFARRGSSWSLQDTKDLGLSFGNRSSIAVQDKTIVVANANYGVFTFKRTGTIWSDPVNLGIDFQNDVVEVDLDGDTIVVCDWGYAVYVFTRTKGVWSSTPTQVPAPVMDYNPYGVALSRDTLLILYQQFHGVKSAAFIFGRNGSMWVQETELTLNEADSVFVGSYSIHGNVAVVSALIDGTNVGANVFVREAAQSTNWIPHLQQPILKTGSEISLGDCLSAAPLVSVYGNTAIVSTQTCQTNRVYVFELGFSELISAPGTVCNDKKQGENY